MRNATLQEPCPRQSRCTRASDCLISALDASACEQPTHMPAVQTLPYLSGSRLSPSTLFSAARPRGRFRPIADSQPFQILLSRTSNSGHSFPLG